MAYLLALDQGTTSSRAIVFDDAGVIRASAQREFGQLFPRPGLVEHDPREIWESQRAVAVDALHRAGLRRNDVAAVGITNQRETTLLWDRRSGEPLHNAIVWQDRRTAGLCRALTEAGHEPTFVERTGLLVDPYFSGTKLRWLLDHVPDARRRAAAGELAFGTVDSWLVWQLTGGTTHATDATNASRTLMYALERGEWDDELLTILDVPRVVLPEVRDSSGFVAEISAVPELAGIPIAGIAGDQHAALFGQACFEPGMAKNTYGTGCFLLLHTGTSPVRSRNRLLSTIAWRIDGRTEYALEGSVFTGGAVVQWLRDGLGLVSRSSDVEALAASVSDAGEVYFVPAFSGLGAPHWDPHARGTIVGLTRGSRAAHIARAALESIAFQSHDVLRAMERDAGFALRELRVDGGAAVNDLLMQFQSDLLGVPVVRPQVVETTALGAASLAGLAVGVWPDRKALAANWSAERRFEPRGDGEAMRERLVGWNRALERSRGWAVDDVQP